MAHPEGVFYFLANALINLKNIQLTWVYAVIFAVSQAIWSRLTIRF